MSKDTEDLQKSEIVWLSPDNTIYPSHAVFILSFDVRDCTEMYSNLDLYVRLRGTLGDSPMFLYRDYEENLSEGARFNFGIHLPIKIGAVHAMDIIFDHPMAVDEEYLITIEDIEFRDAWWVPWADVGKPKDTFASSFTLTARSTSVRIDLSYSKQKYGYNNLHYVKSADFEHRKPWANLSRFDTCLTMTIDTAFATLLAAMHSLSKNVDEKSRNFGNFNRFRPNTGNFDTLCYVQSFQCYFSAQFS